MKVVSSKIVILLAVALFFEILFIYETKIIMSEYRHVYPLYVKYCFPGGIVKRGVDAVVLRHDCFNIA